MYRFDGGDGTNDTQPSAAVWSRRRTAALRVEQAAQAIRLRGGSDTIIGAGSLVDALDAYWQVRYGGRVVIVAGESDE